MSIQHNDLEDLIKTTFSIDQFKSKVGKDENVVVVAFSVTDSDPANDLSQFLESGHDSIDVDASSGPDKDGIYKVYVELERNSKLFSCIDSMLRDISKVDNLATNFKFTSYKKDMPIEWNKDNFEKNVYTSSYDYLIATNPEAHVIAERMKFLNSY
jgi:hypothetical protein